MLNFVQIDIEATNRCNAKCHFCPRDMTPHQGLMAPEVFDQALERAVEFRDTVVHGRGWIRQTSTSASAASGEPLLNKHLAGVRAQGARSRVRRAGLEQRVAARRAPGAGAARRRPAADRPSTSGDDGRRLRGRLQAPVGDAPATTCPVRGDGQGRPTARSTSCSSDHHADDARAHRPQHADGKFWRGARHRRTSRRTT